MTSATPATKVPTTGRRERSKQDKLARITAAARELFAEHGIDEVTTQQIAERADVGAGTVFLYVKTKGELLLLAQNERYAEALLEGRAAAAVESDPVDALVAIIRPIVICNRSQIDNGRTYLREMLFGDPQDRHHAAALTIVAETEQEVSGIISRTGRSGSEAAILSRVISAAMLVSMTSTLNPAATNDDIIAEIRGQIVAVLGAPTG